MNVLKIKTLTMTNFVLTPQTLGLQNSCRSALNALKKVHESRISTLQKNKDNAEPPSKLSSYRLAISLN